MDADKDVNFEFFKYQKKPEAKYQLVAIILWSPFLLGLLISSFIPQKFVSQSELVTVAAPHNLGYVSLVKATNQQESLIDTIQVLNLSDVEKTIKEIKKLGFSIKNIGLNDDRRLYDLAYRSLTGEIKYAVLYSDKNNSEIKISWRDIEENSIFLTAQWDHNAYPIQSVKNGIKTNIELKITHHDIKNPQKISVLEKKVIELQQENDKIKKEYSENIIKEVIKKNPSLKGKEEELKKYINLILNSKQ